MPEANQHYKSAAALNHRVKFSALPDDADETLDEIDCRCRQLAAVVYLLAEGPHAQEGPLAAALMLVADQLQDMGKLTRRGLGEGSC